MNTMQIIQNSIFLLVAFASAEDEIAISDAEIVISPDPETLPFQGISPFPCNGKCNGY